MARWRRGLDTTLPSVIVIVLLGLLVLAGGFDAAASAEATRSPEPPPAAAEQVTPRRGHATAVAHLGPERLLGEPLSRPVLPALAPQYRSRLAADHCLDRDLPTPPVSDPIFSILDRTYALPADYVPPDLMPAAQAGFGGAQGEKLVRAVLIDDLAALRADSLAEGLQIQIQSAYRSYANQRATFDHWARIYGREGASLRSARPGHSEHQLGTAFDFTSPGWRGVVGDWGARTLEGAWLLEHAWRYGFVLSYPPGSTEQTCFSYEPWHYRWIGREAAAAWRESGLALRVFLERYLVED